MLLLLKNRQWDVYTRRRCSAKESVFGSLPNFCCPEWRSGGGGDKSSWLGEIMRRIELHAKPKYLLLHTWKECGSFVEESYQKNKIPSPPKKSDKMGILAKKKQNVLSVTDED